MKKIFVLTGAGISRESGIPTFRDSKDGLWHNHKVEDVASLTGWKKNPQLVLDFYNERRSGLKDCEPNDGHKYLVQLEEYFDVQIFTQNVDDLHEKAGSKNVYHLHGCLTQAKSDRALEDSDTDFIEIGYERIAFGNKYADGGQLRPNVVFFGEFIHFEMEAENCVIEADYVIVVGTSLVVYPVARFPLFRRPGVPLYIVNPELPQSKEMYEHKTPLPIYVQKIASEGMKEVFEILKKEA